MHHNTGEPGTDAQEPAFGHREESARRALNLLFTLNVAVEPLTTDQIIYDPEIGYTSPERESRIKAFNRDRETLANLGLYIRESSTGNDPKNVQRTWEIDRLATHANTGALSSYDAEEAIRAIDQMFVLHADDPSHWPLQMARTKLCKVAGIDPQSSTVGAASTRRDHQHLWSAFARRRPVSFTYRSANGDEKQRLVDLYGMFERGTLMYLVGRDHDADELRTFRVDRVLKVKHAPDSRKPYRIPAAFDISGFQFLPFDFSSSPAVKATFSFAPGVGIYEIEMITKGRGHVEQKEDGSHLWTIEVHDITAAARFAIEQRSNGLTACSPSQLISAISTCKQQAVQAHVS